ncbi:MAG: ubiquinol-cytochrome c reductase iron-sulfur subunit [Gemmatimonadaceae bacterium]|nr:ubiquinol-cytochrome c reductase iron-sulfur subunit [Gemmatimonadaceae bacterium]
MSEPEEGLSNRARADRWRVEFPYRWDADELVSRRQLLRWSVWASGALFASTGALAVLAYTRERRRGGLRAIVDAAAVPVGGVHYFTYPGPDDPAILLHLSDRRFVAYSGTCTHLSCAVYWDAERRRLRCPCHEGVFHPETGDVLAGPPPRPLPRIALRERDGVLYAVEEPPA